MPRTLNLALKQRIPLRPTPVENPSIAQLVFWSLKENILQRMSPSEAKLHPSNISCHTIQRLQALYQRSLQRWRDREAAVLAAQAALNPMSLRERLAKVLTNLNIAQ